MPYQNQVPGGYLLADGTFRPLYKKKGEPFTPHTKWVEYKGQHFKVYSIGWLAYMTNRTQTWLRIWMKRGILPKCLLDLNDGRYWWTAAELVGYTKCVSDIRPMPGVRSCDALKERMHKFKRILRNAYEKEPDKVLKQIKELTEERFKETMLLRRQDHTKIFKEANRLLKMLPDAKPQKMKDVKADEEKKRKLQIGREQGAERRREKQMTELHAKAQQEFAAEAKRKKKLKKKHRIELAAREARLRLRDQKLQTKPAGSKAFKSYAWGQPVEKTLPGDR